MVKYNKIKDYCSWINNHEGELIVRKNSAYDKKGNVYITDGHVSVFDVNGKKIGNIAVPERPSSLIIGGKNGDELFITARSSLYRVPIF